MEYPEVKYQSRKGDRIVCEVCPVRCTLSEGQTGVCRGRGVRDGKLVALNYGRVVSIHVDPIEKKPLYHFLPGNRITSAGPNGCNLHCRWCQNCEISQFTAPTWDVPPKRLAERAMSQGSVGLAYTYAEPMIWFETIMDTAPLVRERGGVNVFVTNGYVEEAPLEDLLPWIDAANVDLKFSDPALYKKGTGAKLEVVQRTIRRMIEAGVHVELTHLLVTGMADNEGQVRDLVQWIASINRKIPLHLSRYFPRHLATEPETLASFMERAYEIARESLRYVYLGNIAAHGRSDTICHRCGNMAVRRGLGGIETSGVTPEGRCVSCGANLRIRMHA